MREAEEEDRMLLTENSSIPSASENQAKYMVLLENDTVCSLWDSFDWKKYLTTDIAKERLPEDVVEDLRDGMDFSSEKDLFAFLENYSS